MSSKKSTRIRLKLHDRSPVRMKRIMEEFDAGFLLLGDIKKAVSIFGSARTPASDPYYKYARELSERLVENGFAVITGGGPGIMEAANRGAYDAKGDSVGLGIKLTSEKKLNKYVNKGHTFYYFFTRKVMLSAPAQAYVFFPGGYGTFDELFELITLIQTKKTRMIPVILYGKEFWEPLYDYLYKHLYKKWKVIDRSHLDMLKIVDSVDEASRLILRSKSRNSLG